MPIKAGYKTSEFWFTLVSFIFSGLYLTGILTDTQQKEELTSVVSHAVESIILISGQMLIFYKYVKGRSDVKRIVQQEKLLQIEEVSNEHERSNTGTNRKSNTRSKRVTKKSKKSSSK